MCKRADIELEDFEVLFGDNSASLEKDMVSNSKKINISDYPVKNIEISKIDEYPNHPFKVVEDEDMQELADNIRQYGVLHPVIVREINGRYQMISGHRRRFASILAGKLTIPARIMQLTDEEAAILMADANFLQRTKILPSEKAYAYKLKYDAIKSQGKKGTKRSLSELGETLKEGEKTIQRFIRLTNLIDDLLNLIDEGKLGIVQGSDISFLSKENQAHVLFIIKMNEIYVSKEQADELKKKSKEKNFSFDTISNILLKKKVPERKVTINKRRLNEYFSESYTSEKIENIIYELLDLWKAGMVNANINK